LLLPLLLSTSAALYRGSKAARKAKEEGVVEEGVGPGALRALSALPIAFWVGIGAVWLYWTATQIGIL
jgi:hypothetical protein